MADSPKPTGGAPEARWWHDRRKLGAAIGAAVVVIGGIAFAAYQLLKRPDDVQNDIPIKVSKPRRPVVRTTNWPMFGFDRTRTRFLPARKVKPPFRRLWKYGDKPLLEFPPIFVDAPDLCERRTRLGCNGRLFFVDNNGFTFSLDADTGKIIWQRRIATRNASSPTYSRGRLLIVNLGPGQILSLDARTGRTIWKRALPGIAESSPVVVGRKVIFGCDCSPDQLYAVDWGSGRTIWSTQLSGAVKAAPAYEKGIVYVGDYGGSMSAVRARDGKIKWQTGALGPGFGAAGSFYSTPAVAFGRVFSGNNDSRVYSFDQKTGELAWTYSTGGYVYSGPTVADTRKSPPTVYIGSFDGNVYALDAKSGEPRWTAAAGGAVIGSLSTIGEIVYVATFEGTTTSGFKLKNGEKAFSYHTGAYMPVVSDGRRIYLTGYSSITALQPVEGKQGGGSRSQGSRADSGQAG